MASAAVTVRPAGLDDVDFLAGVMYRTYLQQHPGAEESPEWLDGARDDTREQVEGKVPRSTTYVLEHDGVPVGRLRVVRWDDRLEIAGLQVMPDRQNRGTGTAAVEHVRAEAEAAGVPVELQVAVDNPDAERLYRRQGFRRRALEGSDYWMTTDPGARSDPDPEVERVAAPVAGISARSGFWFNLHHALYAAAWHRRADRSGERLRLPVLRPDPPLRVPAAGRATWESAVDHYDQHLADRDLLFDREFWALGRRIADGRSVEPQLASVLAAAADAYREVWPEHDRINRAWAVEALRGVGDLAEAVRPRLEQALGEPWPRSLTLDVVWAGGWSGGYTASPALVMASTHPAQQDLTAVESVFHEVAHTFDGTFNRTVEQALGEATGDAAGDDHPTLWHALLFHVVGQTVRQVLAHGGVDYEPYLESTGLLDRAWPAYRTVLAAWQPSDDGTWPPVTAALLAPLRP